MLSEKQQQLSLVTPNELRFNDYLFLILAVIPWNIYKGSSEVPVNNSTQNIDITVFQFWFGRIISLDKNGSTEWKWQFIGSGGDPIYGLFFFIVSFLFFITIVSRFITLGRNHNSTKFYGPVLILAGAFLLSSFHWKNISIMKADDVLGVNILIIVFVSTIISISIVFEEVTSNKFSSIPRSTWIRSVILFLTLLSWINFGVQGVMYENVRNVIHPKFGYFLFISILLFLIIIASRLVTSDGRSNSPTIYGSKLFFAGIFFLFTLYWVNISITSPYDIFGVLLLVADLVLIIISLLIFLEEASNTFEFSFIPTSRVIRSTILALTGVILADYLFQRTLYSFVVEVVQPKFVTRDIHAIAFDFYNLEWGHEFKESSIAYQIPIAIIPLILIGIDEFKFLKFKWWENIADTSRFIILGIFTAISIFPLIWVFIVSINTNTAIRAGVPLWPLDLDRTVSFDVYHRFFKFNGDKPYALGLFLTALFLGFILYHQLTRSGAWLDKIQKIIYEKISPNMANNRNVTIVYWSFFFVSIGVIFSSLILMLTSTSIFGIRPASFEWYMVSPVGEELKIGNWFMITIIICLGVSIAGIFMSALAAYAMSRYNFPAKTSFIGVVLSTQMFPGIILLLPLFVMWQILNLTNSIFGLALAYATFAIPFATFMLKGYFDSIPQDLEEAAMVDGCTRVGAFTRVILPLSLPGLSATFLFTFLTGYTEYLLALTLYDDGSKDKYTISLALLNVFRADIQNLFYPDIALFSILVAMPILFLFVYLQRYLIAGLVAGGTKG